MEKRIGPPYRKQAERTPVKSPPIPACPNRTGSTAILSSRELPGGTFFAWLGLAWRSVLGGFTVKKMREMTGWRGRET